MAIFSSPNQMGAEFHILCSLCGMDCQFHYGSTNAHVVESACINWLCHLVQNEGSAHFYRASSRSIARPIKNLCCMPNPSQRNQKGYLHVQLHFFCCSKFQFFEPLAISFGLDFLRGGSRGGSSSSPSGGLSPPSSWDSCSSSE